MSEINLFEVAVREKYRFTSSKGELTLEQLYSLPLTSKVGPSLDEVGIAIKREIKQSEEESLVVSSPNSAKNKVLSNKLELVKTVIKYKQDLAEDAKNSAAKAELKQKLTAILEKKQDASLENMSEEDLIKQLEALK